jgi:cytoskeletal protein RodZ
LPSFGEKLKQEREKRKIALEQISISTKISTRMLQALEADKFNQLPGGIFNKGFVRAYARFVGLDEEQIVAEYLQASGDVPPVATEIPVREDVARENAERVSRLEASSDRPSRQLPWGLLAAVLLFIALGLSLWNHRQRERARQALLPAPSTAMTPGNFGPSGSSKMPTDSTPATPVANPGEFMIVIEAREESWISTTADGKTAASELLPAGSERSIRGRKEIIVRVGNAGGVDFVLNGKKLGTGGEYGEVKTVTLGPRGILPNAQAAPSTP